MRPRKRTNLQLHGVDDQAQILRLGHGSTILVGFRGIEFAIRMQSAARGYCRSPSFVDDGSQRP